METDTIIIEHVDVPHLPGEISDCLACEMEVEKFLREEC